MITARVFLKKLDTINGSAGDGLFLRMARSIYDNYTPLIALLSGGKHDAARYSIIAWNPMIIFRARGRDVSLVTGDKDYRLYCNPLVLLDFLMRYIEADYSLPVKPFSGGAIGYLAYELKNILEVLPQVARDDIGLPHIYLFWPRRVIVHDRYHRNIVELFLKYKNLSSVISILLDSCSAFSEDLHDTYNMSLQTRKVEGFFSNFTHREYVKAVEKVRDYIRHGEVYQVNLSQRFEFPFHEDPFLLWENLYKINPAPFYAFIKTGDHFILSTSMERFLFRNGDAIETRPIKGTRPRGKTEREDCVLREELLSSKKDDAELSMIVDLLRNDLGKICCVDSVKVSEHKRIESYQNVHHLVSIVKGRLKEDTTYADILKATFPGGSITGCPKIRAMEIIDELEPNVRHVYTGSIGYMGFHQNMDLNIAIRTAIVHRRRCYFGLGGGIVYDSDPEKEYQETLHKGRTLFYAIQGLKSGRGI